MNDINVLVVDDQSSMRMTLQGILEDEGYKVFAVEDGYQSVELAKKVNFKVIFMDVKMIGMNGVEAFKEIKKIRSSVSVIMMTAYSVEDLIKEAIREGAHAIIHKPFEIQKILEILKEAIEDKLILLVDDRLSDRETFKTILEEHGYRVSSAKDGYEAVHLLSQKGFDLAFVDIKMPVMNGVETLKKIKEIKPKLPVMMMTGYSVEELVQEAMKLGAHGCLYKPFVPEKVLQLIEEVLEKQEKDAPFRGR